MKKALNFDEYDMKILLLSAYRKLSVRELQDSTGMAYKNLNPHIKRLVERKFLLCHDQGKGRKKYLTTNLDSYEVFNLVSAIGHLFAKYIPECKEVINVLREDSYTHLRKDYNKKRESWRESNKEFLEENKISTNNETKEKDFVPIIL